MTRHCQSGGSAKVKIGHWKLDDECTTYIGRGFNGEDMNSDIPIGARGWLGNPYKTVEAGGEYTREESVEKFMRDFLEKIENNSRFRREVAQLDGETLGCWCQRAHEDNGDRCHGEVIKMVVEKLNE